LGHKDSRMFVLYEYYVDSHNVSMNCFDWKWAKLKQLVVQL
jgi:hypothetical protein